MVFEGFLGLIILAIIWEVVWKGIGLWRSARNKHLVWFIVILIFNTLGILPIVYVFFFSGYHKTYKKKRILVQPPNISKR